MNIGIVCYPTFGGSGVVATELGIGLAKKGHKVHFITYSQPSRLDFFNENIFYHEVSIPAYPLFQYPPYELALSGTMVSTAQYAELDLFHVHYAIPHASAAYLAQKIMEDSGVGIPFVTTLHGTDITLVGKDAGFSPVVEFSINHSDMVTCVSEDLKRETNEFFNVRKDIKVIPNFIDPQKFQKQKKDHFKKAICPNGEKLLVHTSNFRKVKRVEDVVMLFEKIRERIPAKLLLAGDGPERQNIESKCRELKSCEDIRFLGKMEAIEEILSVSDLFILPSEKESFGLAALEAMACEVPVISSNAGGIPELNVNGVTGFLSDVGDIDDMLKNSLIILDDENLEGFKKRAKERALEFDIERVLPRYEQAYFEVIESYKKNQ